MATEETHGTYTGKDLVVSIPPVGVTLQLATTPAVTVPRPKPKKRVLDEDTYVEAVDKIIQVWWFRVGCDLAALTLGTARLFP